MTLQRSITTSPAAVATGGWVRIGSRYVPLSLRPARCLVLTEEAARWMQFVSTELGRGWLRDGRNGEDAMGLEIRRLATIELAQWGLLSMVFGWWRGPVVHGPLGSNNIWRIRSCSRLAAMTVREGDVGAVCSSREAKARQA